MSNVMCPIAHWARTEPQRLAIVTPETTLTYRELHDKIVALQAALEEVGVEPGHRVLLVASSSLRAIIALHALMRTGAMTCPVAPTFPEAYRTSMAATFQADRVLIAEDLEGDPSLAAMLSFSIDTHVPCLAIATSGSSGEPKLAVHDYGAFMANAKASQRNIPLEAGGRWLLSLPLHHVSGLSVLFRCALAGAAVAIPATGQPLHSAMESLGATHVSLVATQLRRLIHDREERAVLQHLKAILVGGGPIPESLVREALALKLPLHTTYGLTEMASQVATTPHGATPAQLLSSGRALTPDTLRIASGGEIQVRGLSLFLGYWKNGALIRTLTPDGWFATGDLGRIDDGWLHVLGRKDAMFVCGGENLRPEAIERALCDLPHVSQAVVVPVADPDLGQRPVAFVHAREGAAPNAESIIVALKQALPAYMVPRTYLPWPDDIDTGLLKTSRRVFAERAAILVQD